MKYIKAMLLIIFAPIVFELKKWYYATHNLLVLIMTAGFLIIQYTAFRMSTIEYCNNTLTSMLYAVIVSLPFNIFISWIGKVTDTYPIK